MHDIIDNRNEKLIDHINLIMDSTERAKFAVGYFFVSGLSAIKDHLKDIKEIKLLIGNTTNRETLEQIAEGYKRLDMLEREAEGMRYPKRSEIKEIKENTRLNLRETLELMDQTDDNKEVLDLLVQLITEKRLKVKVYTKGRLHAKAYIFDISKMDAMRKGSLLSGHLTSHY